MIVSQSPEARFNVVPSSKPTYFSQACSVAKTTLLATTATIGAALAVQLFYSSTLSPSSSNYCPQTSSVNAYMERFNATCNSSAFKVMNTFLNLFETKQSVFHALDFKTNDPPGEIQAFVFDSNIDALNCAVRGYDKNSFTLNMKNRLLGRVIRHIELNKRNLTDSVNWLLDQGANVHIQEKRRPSELQDAFEGVSTLLTAAYRSLDIKLYEDVLERGFNPLIGIKVFSPESNKFDTKISVFQAIFEDMQRQELNFDDPNRQDFYWAYVCPIYRRMIDATFEKLGDFYDFTGQDLEETKARVYYEISQNLCRRYLKISDDYRYDFRAEELANKFTGYAKSFTDFLKATELPDEADIIVEETDSCWDSDRSDFSYDEFQRSNFAEGASEMYNKIKDNEMLNQLGQSVADGLEQAMKMAHDAGESAINNEMLNQLGQSVVDGVEQAMKVAQDVGESVINNEKLNQLGQSVVDGVEHAMKMAQDVGESAINNEKLNQLGQSVTDGLEQAMKMAHNAGESVTNNEMLKNLGASVQHGLSQLGEQASNSGNKLKDGIEEIANSETVKNLGATVHDKIHQVRELGSSMVQSTQESLSAVQEQTVRFIQDQNENSNFERKRKYASIEG